MESLFKEVETPKFEAMYLLKTTLELVISETVFHVWTHVFLSVLS